MVKVSPKDIDFSRIKFDDFENLCYELIYKTGFRQIKWLQGGSDNGRDIQANLAIENELVGEISEKWFFECKHYQAGVNSSVLDSKITLAKGKSIDHLVFFISSYLTKDTRIWIVEIQKTVSFKIHVIEGPELKNILCRYPALIKDYDIFNRSKKLINSIKERWTLYDDYPNLNTLLGLYETKLDLIDSAIGLPFFFMRENLRETHKVLIPIIEESLIKEVFEKSVIKENKSELRDFDVKPVPYKYGKYISNLDKVSAIESGMYFTEHLYPTFFIQNSIEIKVGKEEITEALYTILFRNKEAIEIILTKDSDVKVYLQKLDFSNTIEEIEFIFRVLESDGIELICN